MRICWPIRLITLRRRCIIKWVMISYLHDLLCTLSTISVPMMYRKIRSNIWHRYFHYRKISLIVRSRNVSKARDNWQEFLNRSLWYLAGVSAALLPRRQPNFKAIRTFLHPTRAFETLRDLTIRHLTRYWIGPQMYGIHCVSSVCMCMGIWLVHVSGLICHRIWFNHIWDRFGHKLPNNETFITQHIS